jgi:hypothetical protein
MADDDGESVPAGTFESKWSKSAQQGSPYRSLSGSGADWQSLSDPFSALAARLGQLKSKQMEAGNPSRGPQFYRTIEKEMGPLEDLYELQLQKMMREEGQAAHQAPHAHSGGRMGMGGGGGSRGFRNGDGGDGGGVGGFRRDEPRMETMLMDPYKEMRESSIKAAQEYLKNPRPILSMKG